MNNKIFLLIAILLLLITNSIAAPPPYCIQQPGLPACKDFCDKNPNEQFCKQFYPQGGTIPVPKTCPPEGDPNYDPNCIDDSSAIPGGPQPTSGQPSGQLDWTGVSIISLFLALLLLIAFYMIGTAFNLQDLKFLATEEFYQLIVTVLMIALFTSIIAAADELVKSFTPSTSYTENEFFNDCFKYLGFSDQKSCEIACTKTKNPKMQVACKNYADSKIKTGTYANSILEKNFNTLAQISSNLLSSATEVGKQSSETAFCAFIGAGININSCSSFGVILSAYSLGFQVLGMALAELESLKVLLEFSQNSALLLFLPLGIFLRTFQLTRPAGGLLIALAISFYLILPLSIIFMDSIITKFMDANPVYKSIPELDTASCDEFDAVGTSNPDNANKLFTSLVANDADKTKPSKLEIYLFYFLIKITLVTISSIMVMITAARSLASAAGAEVDITVLSKLV
ncbi:hypothetical protein HYT84_02520 [Candidatus Micrarchaeota archaeon]|nr:hypothetical protein [Candidatus Micrarchaeota archaeon]